MTRHNSRAWLLVWLLWPLILIAALLSGCERIHDASEYSGGFKPGLGRVLFIRGHMSQLQPHQQRVVDEKAELDGKISALQKFLAKSPLFDDLDEAERWRLTTQCHVMVQYASILGARIAAF